MSAAEYAGNRHTVLYIKTAGLVKRYGTKIELTHMNTGNTRPYPHPRGPATFSSMADYDYERRRRLPDYSAVVELTDLGGVPDIRKDVTQVEHAASEGRTYQVHELLFKRDS
jgi:hypothetical protein